MELHGIHHLTAVSASIAANLAFYTRTMGMRLVKRSVNQDDVSAYHLFYADVVGSPGTDLTFFDWNMPQESRGNRSITRTVLRVTGGESLAWWAERFVELEVSHGQVHERDGRLTLDFEDIEGQRLSLVDDGGRGDAPTPSFTSRCNLTCQGRASALAECITSLSGLRTKRSITPGMTGSIPWECATAARSIGTTSGVSTSGSPTTFFSRSPPTGPGSGSTRIGLRSERRWRCRRFWSRSVLW